MNNKVVVSFLIFMLIVTPSWARWKLDKKEFKQSFQQEELALPLRGVGVKTLFMMRIFVAAFYVDKTMSAQQVLGDVPKHLEVKFFTTIPGSEFAKFTIKNMKINTTAAEFKKIADRVPLMSKLFPNIKSGDIFALTYVPDKGTIFTLNGKERGVIPGADFAKALFATWIGPKPIDNVLKRQVLGFEKVSIPNYS